MTEKIFDNTSFAFKDEALLTNGKTFPIHFIDLETRMFMLLTSSGDMQVHCREVKTIIREVTA